MSKPEFTPHTTGPWRYGQAKHSKHFYVQPVLGGVDIAQVHNTFSHRDERAEADARLIAAAPELLEHLDNVSAAFETCLAHFGEEMGNDFMQRNILCGEARRIVDSFRVHWADTATT
jgi:hypothetical protein